MGPGVYLVDPYGPGPPHQHAPQHHPPPPRAPTPPATPRSPATAAPPPPTRPPGPSAFPVFVASEFEIHGLLTSSALSPPTRACLCVLSLDFVTVPLPRLSFVFSSWGVRVSPSFPFLLLGLRVRVCVCVSVSVSAFESPALFSQQRLPGFVLPVPPSLPPSLPPPSFGGPGGRGFLGCHWCPSLRPPRPEPPPPACVSVACPPTTLESRGGSRLFRGSLQGRDLPAPLPSSAAGVASRRVASLGGGGSGPSSGVWAAGAVASPAAGDSDPSSGRSSRLSGATWRPLVYCPSSSGASASPSGGL